VRAFGEAGKDLERWRVVGRECSPIYYLHRNLPPTLIYHGDADTLVPLDQSERYCAAVVEAGCRAELVVHPRGGHGWASMIFDLEKFADWFDEHLGSSAR
jgi:dipeptidyl aminopeptidase/acylaminoacyl peptidase